MNMIDSSTEEGRKAANQILVNNYFTVEHRGFTHHYTTVGCKSPVEQVSMFQLEKELREDWWNVKQGDVVVDVGASHGSYTLSALAAGAALVVAFEPNHDEIFDLLSNLFVNHWMMRCVVYPVLVGGCVGVEDYDPTVHRGGPKHRNTQKRQITTLDVALEGVVKVDWLKVDADGMELSVFQGALGIIKEHRPRIVNENHVELEPGVDEEIRKILTPLGYTEENRVGEDGTNEDWSLWTPKEKL